MASHVSPLPLPPASDVEVSVRIHTPLNITQHVARQKVNVQLALHCGQSFALEEPELQVGDRLVWRVPVWVTHADKGNVACVGDVRVDAQTGEVLATREQMRLLKAAANGVLQSLEKRP
jgi:ribosomal protein S4E